MSNAELDTYLLKSWADLDAATSRGFAIENAVFEALADEVQRWAAQRGWSGVFTTDVIWLSAPEWTTKTGSRPDADAYFRLDYHGPETDTYSLTSLIGLNQDMAGFGFHQKRMAPKLWKLKATDANVIAKLAGFSVQSTGLFHPFRLEMAAVLDAASTGDYTNVAEPIISVLEKLEAAAPTLSELMVEQS